MARAGDCDLREMNELNFARFEAKLDAKLAGLRGELLKWMFLFWVTILGALIAFRG